MSGFVKIFGTILRSSVWQQPLPTKIVWITMLALADGNGLVEASVPGLAATAGVTIEECERALECFLAPDKYSGSTVDEGRRIRACRGGWLIINHRFYRELRTEKQIREAERIKKKRARPKRTAPVNMLPTLTNVADVAPEAEAEAEIMNTSDWPSAGSDPSAPVDAPRSEVAEVFEHWKRVCERPKVKLLAGDKRDRAIKRALKRYSKPDLLKAIDGCARSDFHMARGQYAGQQNHDELASILGDEAKIDAHIARSEGNVPPRASARNGASSFEAERVL